ncbi:DUF4097 family beta strand repeat-containing protein [Streptomyces sp. NPDC059037]|uniref:DUF4097 family beta strand repeat-containing protein n=1 Tax=Streptomyces sp. NPDC059037 TaxID=3346710 RepID=UPI00368655F4
MPKRTFVSPSAGPIVLGLSLPVGRVYVDVSEGHPHARVVLHTEDNTGPAADAVSRARSEQSGQVLGIEVPEMPGNVMVQSVSGSRVTQTVGTVHGSVTGVTIVNGRVVTGSSSGMQTVSPIQATVYLPAGSSLGLSTTSADTVVWGDIDRMELRSVSGDLDACDVRDLTVNSTSGDIRVNRVTEQITVRSVSGDIEVGRYDGRQAQLSATSGDIRVQATAAAFGHLSAHSVSGDVQIAGARHLSVSADSVSGRVRNG